MAIPVDILGQNTVSPARLSNSASHAQDFHSALSTARNNRTGGGGAGGRPALTSGAGNGSGNVFAAADASGSSAPAAAQNHPLPGSFFFIPLLNGQNGEEPAPLTRQDLESDADGRIEYTAQEQDSIATVAERFGRTEEEIIAANPQLVSTSGEAGTPPAIDPGQTIVVYNDARAPAIVELVNTADAERRAELIHQQLLASVYSNSGNSPTPGDFLPAAQAELTALKPNDAAFAQQVSDQGIELTYNWQSMGLTHAVWDPLLEAAENGDWAAFDEILTGQLQTLATTSPTVAEIEAFGEVLDTYAPDEDFRSAVAQTIEDFLVNDPAAAAEEIALPDIYDPQWPLASLERLRELTDPLTVDPLTAALIVNEAWPKIEPMVDQIGTSLSDSHRIYEDLSAVADSVARSPEGEDVLDGMLDVLLPEGQDSLDGWQYEVILGAAGLSQSPLLSLALADRLLERGNVEQATSIAQAAAGGVRRQEEELIGSVNSLSETLLPLFTPMQWDPFLSEANGNFEIPSLQTLGEQWLSDNPEIEEQVNEQLEQINEQMYWLNRSRGHLDDYAPRLETLEGHEERVELAHADPSQEDAPQIAFAAHLSPASAIDDLREANLAGGEDGTLTSLSQIILDPNWHLRMYPRAANAVAGALDRPQPFPSSLGLTLYNGSLYGSGVLNQGRELMAKIDAHGFFDAIFDEGGWRNIVSGFHYGWGAAIEGTALANLVTGRNLPSSATWRARLNNSLLGRSFAIYNVIGTGAYALEGNVPGTVGLGIATVGSVTSNFLIKEGSRFFIPRLAATGWAAPGANILLVVGTGVLIVNDISDRERLAAASEPFNEAYLVAAGVDPAIAHELANNSSSMFNGVYSDNPGASPAGPLGALADYRDITPGELLQWLNEQEPEFVAAFVNRIHRVHPDDNGEYPITREPEGLGWDWGRLLELSSPLTVDGVPAELLIGDPGAIKTRQSLEDIAGWAQDVGRPLPQGN